MDIDQIAEELRDLSDKTDRLEAAIDTIGVHLTDLRDRDLPKMLASQTDASTVDLAILADLAGTAENLATELHSHKDRLTLLERHWE